MQRNYYLILILSLLVSCSHSPTKPQVAHDGQSLYRMAEQAEQSGFIDTARKLHEKNLHDNQHQDSLFALFWLYRDMSKKAQAQDLLNTHKWQNVVHKQCAQAVQAMDNQQWQQAYKTLKQLDLTKLKLKRCRQAKAVLLDKMHQPKQAQAIYLSLLQQEPKRFSLRYNLALSFIASKQADKVPELFAQECSNPSHSRCSQSMRQIMALSYGLQNQPDMARRYLKTHLNEAQIQAQLALYQKLRQIP